MYHSFLIYYIGRTSDFCLDSHNTLKRALIKSPAIIIGKVAIPPTHRKKLIGVTAAQFKQSLQSSLLKVGFFIAENHKSFIFDLVHDRGAGFSDALEIQGSKEREAKWYRASAEMECKV